MQRLVCVLVKWKRDEQFRSVYFFPCCSITCCRRCLQRLRTDCYWIVVYNLNFLSKSSEKKNELINWHMLIDWAITSFDRSNKVLEIV
ncbi:Uncharacterized protein BM_BM1005 [Brugia malayi]|uniref:Bm1005 n=2 Tax=Brugia malayi TaxID=6279 RepID=A0A0K0ILW5_BRUMA|nr:Uncharacterized protein BM_BM1005 [Brugia malayi]CDQ01838.1 Bm1005 [Brugia malayi]VIO95958.1 Uncharacterized protein BM_BM1005 [Brugia malayi]